jgi:hypothetical protein
LSLIDSQGSIGVNNTTQHEALLSSSAYGPLPNQLPLPLPAPLPSPPDTTLKPAFGSQISPNQLGSIGLLTPPYVNDASGAGLINCFYAYFHPAHPFLPPQHCLSTLDGWYTTHLELARRFIGSLYVPSSNSAEYREALQQSLSQNGLPMDGTRVQTLLLFAIGLHMSDLEQESADIMRSVAKLAVDLGMNRREFAVQFGGGQPLVEECWRRTWWEVFVCDGIFTGVNPMHYQLILHGIKQDVFLPCEEDEFHSGVRMDFVAFHNQSAYLNLANTTKL